jgi:NADH dehydrogenase
MSRDNIASMQMPNILPFDRVDALTKVFGISRRTLESLK